MQDSVPCWGMWSDTVLEGHTEAFALPADFPHSELDNGVSMFCVR